MLISLCAIVSAPRPGLSCRNWKDSAMKYLIIMLSLVSPLARAEIAPADLTGRVHDLFVARCAECQSPAPKGRGEDPTYLTDFSELAKDGSIVNLTRPEESRLFKFVKNGMMPKSEPDKGQVRAKLSEAEVQVVLEWIKAGAPAPAASAPVANAPKFISEEHVIELIAQDLRKNVAEFDQPRTRYLSLVNLHNARSRRSCKRRLRISSALLNCRERRRM